MKPRKIYLLAITFLFVCSFTKNLNAQCCKLPDSLKVKTITDSSFCLQWMAKDTSSCDTAKSFQVEFRPVNDSIWNVTSKRYNGVNVYTFCDSAMPCTKYEWKVRNICIHSGDSTFTTWVKGPKFTTLCDSGRLQSPKSLSQLQQIHNVQITPNPAHDKIVVTGNYKTAVRISLSNINGKKVFDKNIVTVNHMLNVSINTSTFEKGIYFINVADATCTIKLNFLKE